MTGAQVTGCIVAACTVEIRQGHGSTSDSYGAPKPIASLADTGKAQARVVAPAADTGAVRLRKNCRYRSAKIR